MMNCRALYHFFDEKMQNFFPTMEHSQICNLNYCDHLVDSLQNVNLKKILDDNASNKVFIEKPFISEGKDFVQSVAVLVALHYMFNVTYSAKLNSIYTFLQGILNLICKLKSDNLIFNLK